MILINIERSLYNQIASLLPDIWPGIKVDLISEDSNLEKLGFCTSAPCVVSINLSVEEYEHLLDRLQQIEVDAFNTDDGQPPQENDLNYIRYLKYGWIWNKLCDIEYEIK